MKIYLILLCVTFSPVCFSQHKAHVHGVGNLTVVYEDHQLLVEIETPAANILGFENEPHSEEEIATLTKVVNLVKDPSKLFTVDSSCDSTSVEVDMPFVDELTEEDHDHQDIRLSYQWQCQNQSVPSVHVHVFDLFSGFETLNSQWIVNGNQGSTRLNKNNPLLKF